MVYYYRSRVGTFWIRPQSSNPGRVQLGVGDEILGSYHSPQAAADDVYTQHTGFDAWDSLPSVTEPTDLSEWQKGSAG
jgi:hypothetical protein